MRYQSKTLRRMPQTTRKLARLVNELDSGGRKLGNLVEAIRRLELDSKALATAKQSIPVWLHTQALTEALTENLTDFGIEATTENLTKLWNDFVATELHEGLQGCLKYSPAFRDTDILDNQQPSQTAGG